MKQDTTNYNQIIDLLETLGECIDDYVFISDPIKDVFSTTEAAAKKFGMPNKSFGNASKIFATFMHPDDYPMLLQQISEFKSKEVNGNCLECRWFDRMGNTVWVCCRSHLIKGEHGNSDLVVGTITELGQKRRADNVTGFRGMGQFKDRFNLKKYNTGYIMRLFVRNIFGLLVKHGEENVNTMLGIISNAIRDNLKQDQECFYHGRGIFMIFSEYGDEKDAFSLFKKINDTAVAVNDKSDYRYAFKLRCGAVFSSEYCNNVVDTIKKCEFSASYARNLQSKSFYIFENAHYEKYNKSRELISAMQFSVKNGFHGFDVYYQPIFNAKSGKLCACEALLRYTSDTFGNVSPDIIVPLLEESGLIIPIGRWVLQRAVEQCKKWKKHFPKFRVGVNLSYVQLERHEIMQEILDIIKENGLDNWSMLLEFTESGNILNDITKKYAKIIRDNNISLALDDFGSGYSNLLYLNELNADCIKIDRNFVAASSDKAYCYDLIRHIIEIAHSIDIKVCVEGIETKEELENIAKLDPDFYQGFYFGKPVPPEEFENKYIPNQ